MILLEKIKTNPSLKENSLSFLTQTFDVKAKEILLTYNGPFDSDIMKVIGEKVKIMTLDYPQAGRKVFFTFIELAQNVSFYSNEKSKISDKKNAGLGSLIVGETKDKYYFVTGNIIYINSVATLIHKINIINSLDREELRKYKKEQRNLIPGSNGNAHIGLIMTALTTKTQTQAYFTKIDNKQYYFSIYVDIEKEN